MRSDYAFVGTDTTALVTAMIAAYEKMTGTTVQPASPERLFILWVADIIVQTRVAINYAANQNIPSRAVGENLDTLAELFYTQLRPSAKAATCTVRFSISEAQESAILIPAGTRVTDVANTLIWATTADVYIPIGSTTADVAVRCQTAGTVGNGYLAGQLNTVVDVFPYYVNCSNITVADGGANAATDAEFFELLKASEDAYSTAGPMGAYVYWAKSVSTEIADVKAIRPKRHIVKTIPVYGGHAFLGGDNLTVSSLVAAAAWSSVKATITADYTVSYADGLLDITIKADGTLASATQLDVSITGDGAGHVDIYALMDDGTIATDTVKALILAACNDDKVRPLTDLVSVKDPAQVDYNIALTYYIPSDTTVSAAEIKAQVDAAVADYAKWQCAKLGRDINPSKLISLLMQTGVKRVAVTSPVFTQLSDGSDHSTPQVAKLVSTTVTSGGYEDE